MSLRQQTIAGVRWNFFGRIGSQAFQFVAVVILARILTPADFGLLGMTIVFTGFVGLFRDAGFGSALVQKLEIDERHLSSVFWINLVLGAVLAGLVVALAPIIADFFREPQLVAITRVIALDFLIGSFSIVQMAQFRRDLQFRTLTLVEVSAKVAAGSGAIIMALVGFGVWSLVWQSLLNSLFIVAGAWTVSKWRPQSIFDKPAIQGLLKYSSNLLAFNLINYWARNADNLLIGRFVGSTGLGIYSRAYGLMNLPLRNFSFVIGQVMFPVLSRVQDDIPRIKSAYLKANRLIGLVTIPFSFGFLVTAESLVLSLLGPKWVEVTPILQILCIASVKQPMAASIGWLLTSLGRTDTLRRWAFLAGSVNLAAVAIGVHWGVTGVAVGYVVFVYAVHYHSVIIPGRLVDVSFREYHMNLAGVFGCGLLMMGCLFALKTVLPGDWPHPLKLGTEFVVGGAVYWLLVRGFRVRAYREMWDLFPELKRRTG